MFRFTPKLGRENDSRANSRCLIMSKMKEPGLDGRHRDINGRISQKHGNTKVSSLRNVYGENFAAGTRSDAKLSTVLNRAGVDSLSRYLKKD